MSEIDEYILDAIHTWVWSGFYDEDEIQGMLGDLLEEGANEAYLRAAVKLEWNRKRVDERSWPAVTYCDRLDDAFDELESRGIIALHNAGSTMSEGMEVVSEALEQRDPGGPAGYCFYHEQDVESVLAGGTLWIAYGDLDPVAPKNAAVGHIVKSVLEGAGFTVVWNGKPEDRLSIPGMDWKRRAP